MRAGCGEERSGRKGVEGRGGQGEGLGFGAGRGMYAGSNQTRVNADKTDAQRGARGEAGGAWKGPARASGMGPLNGEIKHKNRGPSQDWPNHMCRIRGAEAGMPIGAAHTGAGGGASLHPALQLRTCTTHAHTSQPACSLPGGPFWQPGPGWQPAAARCSSRCRALLSRCPCAASNSKQGPLCLTHQAQACMDENPQTMRRCQQAQQTRPALFSTVLSHTHDPGSHDPLPLCGSKAASNSSQSPCFVQATAAEAPALSNTPCIQRATAAKAPALSNTPYPGSHGHEHTHIHTHQRMHAWPQTPEARSPRHKRGHEHAPHLDAMRAMLRDGPSSIV